jgi:hypothetical protein
MCWQNEWALQHGPKIGLGRQLYDRHVTNSTVPNSGLQQGTSLLAADQPGYPLRHGESTHVLTQSVH